MRSFILTLLLFAFFSILKAQAPCEISNLTVATGDCTGDSTYAAVVNFEVSNTTNASFDLWANNIYVGNYPLSALPVTIQNFPYNGGVNDVVKVCINDNPNCCRTKEFPVPACITNPQPCEIFNLTVATGDCTGDSTYAAIVNFQVQGSTNASFDLWANNIYVGNYPLSALPVTIQNFPYNGGVNDVVKVCINDNPNCCKVKEFPVPACITNTEPCEIFNLTVATGDCTGDSTYAAIVNFQVQGSTNASFDLWANNIYVGNYPLSALPVTIQNFPYNGGVNDVVKVCINDNPNCCKVKEFPVPACITNTEPCEIYDLTVITGDCTGDSTYMAKIDFEVSNTTNASFDLWANNIYVGNYPLSALPVTIQNFPYNGGVNDFVKVCINDNPNCCKVKEFPVPACITNTEPCEIVNLTVATGECNGDSTYAAIVNFEVSNTTNALFDLWANGTYIGNYPLSALPVTIQNFPYNGGANDFIKVCINDNPNCCKVKEFPVPACIMNPQSCEIFNLTVTTGNCWPDSTYFATINFGVQGSTNALFDLWANGIYMGNYPLSALPLTIEHFPYNGGANDFVKVCINDNANCCQVKEFPVPSCFLGDCLIDNLLVQTTACVCGKFFAVITFDHENGSNDGFDIGGNGVNYGNFSYNQQQPIILGPLEGDNTTPYEFVVRDHNLTGCKDAVEVGKIDCPESPTFEIINNEGNVQLAPNPASSSLSVTATLRNGALNGSGQVSIISADGRVVKNISVNTAASFSINIGDLPPGTYELVLDTDLGRLTGKFSKI